MLLFELTRNHADGPASRSWSTARRLVSAQTAPGGEPRWSCDATRMQVSARVKADRVGTRLTAEMSSPIEGAP